MVPVDVQNSTVLWEQLPEEVMDLALKLHHSTFRTLLPRYDGYESGTGEPAVHIAQLTPWLNPLRAGRRPSLMHGLPGTTSWMWASSVYSCPGLLECAVSPFPTRTLDV